MSIESITVLGVPLVFVYLFFLLAFSAKKYGEQAEQKSEKEKLQKRIEELEKKQNQGN